MMIVIRVSTTADIVSHRVRGTAPKIEISLATKLAGSADEYSAHPGMFHKLISAAVETNLNRTKRTKSHNSEQNNEQCCPQLFNKDFYTPAVKQLD